MYQYIGSCIPGMLFFLPICPKRLGVFDYIRTISTQIFFTFFFMMAYCTLQMVYCISYSYTRYNIPCPVFPCIHVCALHCTGTVRNLPLYVCVLVQTSYFFFLPRAACLLRLVLRLVLLLRLRFRLHYQRRCLI